MGGPLVKRGPPILASSAGAYPRGAGNCAARRNGPSFAHGAQWAGAPERSAYLPLAASLSFEPAETFTL